MDFVSERCAHKTNEPIQKQAEETPRDAIQPKDQAILQQDGSHYHANEYRKSVSRQNADPSGRHIRLEDQKEIQRSHQRPQDQAQDLDFLFGYQSLHSSNEVMCASIPGLGFHIKSFCLFGS